MPSILVNGHDRGNDMKCSNCGSEVELDFDSIQKVVVRTGIEFERAKINDTALKIILYQQEEINRLTISINSELSKLHKKFDDLEWELSRKEKEYTKLKAEYDDLMRRAKND
jgi:prefoldin subunit 5